MATSAFHHRAPCQVHLCPPRRRKNPHGPPGKDPVRRRRREEGRTLDWPPQFSFRRDREGTFPSWRMTTAAVVGSESLHLPERTTARMATASAEEMEAGTALVSRLRSDAAALAEVGPARGLEWPRPLPKEIVGRFQHALKVLGKARSGPELEEALILACQMVDRHLVRFVGAEMEASAALFSVLATETAARRETAVAAKLANEQRGKEAVAEGGAAGEPSTSQQQEQQQ
ncbi:unnamed protein product, partial [Scytosiphon promiscuus]